jgi:hypothetical protein
VGRDLRYALRGLSRRPAFTFAAVLTLALGIGATTAIFSVVYSVLIRPLPYPNADELVRIQYRAAGIPNSGLASSEPSMYFTFGDESQTLAGLGMWQGSDATLSGYGEPERVLALQVVRSPKPSTDPRRKVLCRSFSPTHSGNGVLVATKRCSGASSRSRRQTAAALCP